MGSLLGFTMVAKAFIGIKWSSIGIVVASWFVSPAASGFISIIGYYLIYKFILTLKPLNRKAIVIRILPAFFGVTVFVNIFSILFMGPSFVTPFPKDKTASALFALGVSLLISAIVWLVVLFYWVPKQRKAIDDILSGKQFAGAFPADRRTASQFISCAVRAFASCYGAFFLPSKSHSRPAYPVFRPQTFLRYIFLLFCFS
jgi:phosphate/sulfate permease